jgi:hypothetical protein
VNKLLYFIFSSAFFCVIFLSADASISVSMHDLY